MKPSRQKLIAAIHVAKKQLGLDDDTYRDMLQHVTGQRSAKDLTIDQLSQVMKHLEQSGFKNAKSFGDKPDVAKQKELLIKKIEAHLAENKLHWNYAKGIAKKMFQKEALEFCTKNELHSIVAALEYKAKRAQNHETRTRRVT